MRELEGKPPFKFNVANIVKRMNKLPVSVDAKVKISVPFLEVSITPDVRERKIAREIVIRLSDRRVLNSWECCDSCIDNAITSLKEIRKILVDKQVEFSDKADSGLYILMDSIRDSIRQFLTFEERLAGRHKDEHRPSEERQIYFLALEMLRAHIRATLIQIAKIADVEISDPLGYTDEWHLEGYETPNLEAS